MDQAPHLGRGGAGGRRRASVVATTVGKSRGGGVVTVGMEGQGRANAALAMRAWKLGN